MADDFLGGDCLPWIDQCWRRNGDLLRFDPEREWFGVLAQGDVILTFYIPDPSEHGCATNREYFEEQRRR